MNTSPPQVSSSDPQPAVSLRFEQAIEQLQQSVRRLESGELSLEDSLKSFEEGIRLVRACQDTLQKAERRVEQLIRVNAQGEAELEPFAHGGKG
ncbi:MAG: exodeoxyribonuclease VII small subunit [Bdellovibrionales bacterium]|nr:exodeoxyribonuclease VII small subunit [Bdellovibrionales bacterium]